jgi:hypothetical protein
MKDTTDNLTPKPGHLEKQEAIIERHLKRVGSISPRRAVNLYDVYRLAAVIFRLKNRREKPLNIKTELIYLGVINYAQYSLVKKRKTTKS